MDVRLDAPEEKVKCWKFGRMLCRAASSGPGQQGGHRPDTGREKRNIFLNYKYFQITSPAEVQ